MFSSLFERYNVLMQSQTIHKVGWKMSDDALRRRLKRLGRKSRKRQEPQITAKERVGLPSGDEIETPHGKVFRIQELYPRSYQHAGYALSKILEFESELAARVVRQPELEGVSFEDMLFLDTETTGLAGGAGTIAFLVGVGRFSGDHFRLRQYFLREPGEEAGLLHALQEDLENAGAIVSFNGRVFDVPLLEMRYMLGLRKYWSLSSLPQIDLLHPSRRLWRRSLPDCSLGTIERNLLGVQRSDEDVPGALIPGMYLDYLRTGDASDMTRVLYHNAIDILSLVGLAVHVFERHNNQDPDALSGAEALALARWHQSAGREKQATASFQAALASSKVDVQVDALRHFSALLKRAGRRTEAVEYWQTWHSLAVDDPHPCIELAKYHEWYAQDFAAAQHWAQEALQCLTHWPSDWRRDQQWSEIEHRLKRLASKMLAK
jgi:uncharacterized protein YprB with RNaseH-like and TPR domain